MNYADIRGTIIAFLVSKSGVIAATVSSWLLAKLLASYHVYMGAVEVFFGINDTQLSTYIMGAVLALEMAGIGWLKTHWLVEGNKEAQKIISDATGVPLTKDGVIGSVTLNALTQAVATPSAQPTTKP